MTGHLAQSAPTHQVRHAARPRVSIVMPCLNERETVGACVAQAREWLTRGGRPGEVVVVDNGSSDDSAAIARQAGARVILEPRRGYGNAIRRGFAEADGDWLVMGDCDLTYDFSRLDELLRPLGEGYSMSVGNRHAGGIEPGAMPWAHRYIGTPVISLLLRLFTGLKVGDSQCGLRAITKTAADELELRAEGMEFASEMILKAARRGMKVADVPIPYGVRGGDSKLSTVRDGWRHLRFLLLASPNYMFTIPGIVLSALGALTLGLALPNDTIEIGTRTWQPIFAGGIFLVVGVNAILLGLVSKLYTEARGLTNPDWMLRFYREYLGLEILLGAGVLLVLAGASVDLLLAIQPPEAVSTLGLAAIAQSLIIIGANVALAGALASLIEDE